MKILFIRPLLTTYLDKKIVAAKLTHHYGEPTGILSLAANLPEKHEIDFIDLEFEPDLEAKLSTFQPDIAGITCPSLPIIPEALDTLKRIRKFNPGIITVAGGLAVTMVPEEFNCDALDILGIGEAEITFKELVDAIEKKSDYKKIKGIAYRVNGKLVFTEPRPRVRDCDSLPVPMRTLCRKYAHEYTHPFVVDPIQYLFPTRGCKHRCSFCSLTITEGDFRAQSAERAFKELSMTDTPALAFIHNDFFTDDPVWSDKLVNMTKAAGIKKKWIQCRTKALNVANNPKLAEQWRNLCETFMVAIGLETISSYYLKQYNKPATLEIIEKSIKVAADYDLLYQCFFMIDPSFEEKDFDELEDFITRHKNLIFCRFLVTTPYPATKFYSEVADRIIVRDWKCYDQLHLVIPPALGEERFQDRYDALWELTKGRVMQYIAGKKMADINIDVFFDTMERFDE